MDITKSDGLLPGMLNPLVLKAISLDRLHGYRVLLRIQQSTAARVGPPSMGSGSGIWSRRPSPPRHATSNSCSGLAADSRTTVVSGSTRW